MIVIAVFREKTGPTGKGRPFISQVRIQTIGSGALANATLETVTYGGSGLAWDILYASMSSYEQTSLSSAAITFLGSTVTEISAVPGVTEYYPHDPFDLTGTVVTATLSTGGKQLEMLLI